MPYKNLILQHYRLNYNQIDVTEFHLTISNMIRINWFSIIKKILYRIKDLTRINFINRVLIQIIRRKWTRFSGFHTRSHLAQKSEHPGIRFINSVNHGVCSYTTNIPSFCSNYWFFVSNRITLDYFCLELRHFTPFWHNHQWKL